MNIELERILATDHGTVGTLTVDGFVFFTLEEEWKNNRVSESCIPSGTYPLSRTVYHRYNLPTFEVEGVPSRSRILFHPGNVEEDTEGCILLGKQLGILTVDKDEETGRRAKKLAVLQSRAAFNKFMSLMQGVERGTITVRWP